MNRTAQTTIRALMGVSMVFVGVALAQDYDIDWHTVDGGGVMWSTGGDFELSGTIGQADAGLMIGGDYELTGGFWFAVVPGDCDADADVDLHDFIHFEACLSGPGGGVGAGCSCVDFDADADVDLADFADFQAVFSDG